MKKQNITYKFFDKRFSVLENRPGLVCSPLLCEKQKNTSSFYKKKKKYLEIIVQVNEKEIVPHCKINLIHQALACLEKNPQQKKLLDVLQAYTKPLIGPFDKVVTGVLIFLASASSLIVAGACGYGFVTLIVVISHQLVLSLLGIVGIVTGLTIGFAALAIIALGIIGLTIKFICEKLNPHWFNSQPMQHLESLLQAICVNEEAEVEKRIAPKFSEPSRSPRQTGKTLHFFSFNTNNKMIKNNENEEAPETVKVSSAYQAVI